MNHSQAERVPTASPTHAEPVAEQIPSFEQLRAGFHHGEHVDYERWFYKLITNEIQTLRSSGSQVRALDVGCGMGMGRDGSWTRQIAATCDELWGVEPDPSITPAEGCFTHFQNATMEHAELPEGHFDLIFSFQVIEHVADPAAFMDAVSKALRPGGVHLFYTVNGQHYFAKLATTARRLRIDGLALRIALGEKQAEIQYPVQYKLNTPQQITPHALRAGFDEPQYAYLDKCGPRPYMVGPLRPIYRMLERRTDRLRRSELLIGLAARMRKTGDNS